MKCTAHIAPLPMSIHLLCKYPNHDTQQREINEIAFSKKVFKRGNGISSKMRIRKKFICLVGIARYDLK
jgi:hypothetical protein